MLSSCSNSSDLYDHLRNHRIFSLSQYGHYLFLFKLSFHFTRMQEGIDRDKERLVS